MSLFDDNLLSPLVLNMVQMADLLQAEQSELDCFLNEVNQQKNQLYICTSDRELSRYELMFALPINTSLSVAERRTKLIAKLNSRASATVKSIIQIVSLMTGKPCEISEHFSEYSFTVRMLFEDITGYHNFFEVVRQICEIKPAHLEFDVAASYAPLGVKNSENVRITSLYMPFRISNFGVEVISFDGRKTFDGSWWWEQIYTKGIKMPLVKLNLRIKNKQSTKASVTADTMYYFNGGASFDGKKKFDADIVRSEI